MGGQWSIQDVEMEAGITAERSTEQGRGRNASEISHKCTGIYVFLIILSTIVCLNGIRYYKNNFKKL